MNLKTGLDAPELAFVSYASLSALGVVEQFHVLQQSFCSSFLGLRDE
jgi:hypothetical protein